MHAWAQCALERRIHIYSRGIQVATAKNRSWTRNKRLPRLQKHEDMNAAMRTSFILSCPLVTDPGWCTWQLDENRQFLTHQKQGTINKKRIRSKHCLKTGPLKNNGTIEVMHVLSPSCKAIESTTTIDRGNPWSISQVVSFERHHQVLI